ncbi:MAG: hypothetical protein IM600_07595 [Bacteroidetes bacterium]|nr:hypothetical protein [Bacteroidota bacterium]MCA6443273.1 hypothetical protein [Bacteroidota bacterium]
MNKLTYIGLCVFLLFNFSCKNVGLGNKNEGEIIFDTKGVDETHPLYGLAPSSATLKFKEDKFVIEMSTMGMFNTAIIGDNQTKTLSQTVKFMDINQACIETEKEILENNNSYQLKIEETKETKKIAGIKCYKLKVTKVSEPNVSFDAWYTKELGKEDCNALTPYNQVKGMLLDYRIKKMGLEMHFSAKKINNIEIDDNVFEIPDKMKIVSGADMKRFFDNLQ